jgi:hypothetical protein
MFTPGDEDTDTSVPKLLEDKTEPITDVKK